MRKARTHKFLMMALYEALACPGVNMGGSSWYVLDGGEFGPQHIGKRVLKEVDSKNQVHHHWSYAFGRKEQTL